MSQESKKLVGLLKKAQLEEALECAEKMKNTSLASEILSDFAGSLVKHLYEYETAEQLLKKAISLNPKNAEAHYNLGVLYTEPALLMRNEGKLAEAEKAYLRAIKLKPDFMEAHYNLSLLYHFTGRSDEAELEQSVVADSCEEKDLADGLKKILSKKRKKIDVEKFLD
jgi:tetratricopeptide (TPR) repeat protein